MALSGSISKTFTNNSMITAILSWTATQNIADNTSSVTASLKLRSNNSQAPIPSWNGITATITINGSSASSAINSSTAGGTTSGNKYSRTVTVPHNADGTKSFGISFSINFNDVSWNGSRIGIQSASGTGVLNTIPRASSIGTISGNQIGSTITVPITRASTTFTHDVSIKLGTQTVSVTGATTSASLTPNLANFCGQLPNSTSGTATVTVVTKNSNTVVGTKTKTHTIYVPSSVVPSVSTFNVVENIAAVKNLNLGSTTFVQNKSQLGMTAGASGTYGSSIKDYTFSYNGTSQGGTVGRSFNVGNTTGAKEVKVIATDSRGRKAERKFNITILAYQPPKINSFSVARLNNGTTVQAKVNYTVTNIASKGGIWYIDYKEGASWPNKNNGTFTTTHTATFNITGNYDVAKSHTFRTNLHDAFGLGATSSATVSTAKVLLHVKKDIGVGVGKMHEKGVLDVGGESYLNGVVNIKTNTNLSGDDHLVNFTRKDGSRIALLTTNKEESHLRLHFYNGNETWLNNHSFNSNGDVALGKDLTVQGKVMENYVRLVDSWQNTGGWTLRFADGTQICWKIRLALPNGPTTILGSVYRTTPATWTYPSTFVGVPSVTVYPDTDLGYTWAGLGDKASTATYASVAVFSGSSQATKPMVSILAIGRWK